MSDEDPLKNLRDVIKTLEENQETLDSNKELELKDYRSYIADLNYSLLEIFKKMERNVLKNLSDTKPKDITFYI